MIISDVNSQQSGRSQRCQSPTQ